uniref:Fowlerpain-2 n=1 Tax=Naegleria fowleri TaxID=5763 RepID=A0A1L1XWF9_NAEFO|nr:Fowlerpain-2 [Naegleria fowleri]
MKNLFLATVLALLAAACLVSAQSHLDKPVHDAFLIERINRDSSVGWTATKYAKFSDMSLRDARKMLGTVLIDPVHNLPKKSVLSARAPAQSFDARTKWGKCVHAIRDQQQCGSCWAFSASEVLSDRFCIASNGTIDVILSPEYMLQCDTSDYGCDGGYLNNAWNFLATTGIPTDNCDPYTSGGGDVGSCPTACNNGAAIKLYKAKNPQQLNTITDIQNDLQQNGPVQAAFSVYQDFFSYKSGVYRHVSGSLAGGHAIKIVGWGVTSDGRNTPYWIVANSWGVDWGLDGFFWILRGKDECGIEDNVWSSGVLL